MDQAKGKKKAKPEVVKTAQDPKSKKNPAVGVGGADVNMKATEPASAELKKPMLNKFPKTNMKSGAVVGVLALIVVLAGVGTGYAMSGVNKGSAPSSASQMQEANTKSDKEAGIEDESAFPDTAEGILEEGGIEGEGTHHLVREGGPTKYVYVTSTVIDLESFKGKTVQIWGETISAKHAGWLMDVGKIKVTE